MIQRILRLALGLILLFGLAAVFFISGWSKLETIEPFSWSFIDVLPIGVTGASVLARIFIGLEWAVGAWLAAHIFLRRITYKATISLLFLLTLYLIGLIVAQGNSGNCGCFGEWLYMKPSAAIWKNVVLIAITGLLWFFYPSRPYQHSWAIGITLAIAAFTLPFIFQPVYINGSPKTFKEPLALDSLYLAGHPPPAVELRRGAHIICFFSTTCPHCIKGAYLVQILHRKYPELPIFMVLHGGYNMQQEFLEESKSAAVPHTLVMNSQLFTSMAGPYVPAIYWVRNSVIERKTYYTDLEPGAIKDWLQSPYSQ
jgi:uncharacterized membrane protein YphA (DoxX/SURF4 family)